MKLRSALRLIAGVFRRQPDTEELDEEIQFHLDKATERNIRAGMSPDDARHAALVTFGGRMRWRDSARDEQRSAFLDDFLRDLRYGIASLKRNPSFAATAIATIALGLAAVVSVFSLVNSIYLRPLDVPEGPRLVRLYDADRPRFELAGYPAFRILRQNARSFDYVAAHYSTAPLYLTARGESVEESGAVVSAEYFPMLGIRPALGRFFLSTEDSVPDRDAVAVLGHTLWQRRFGGDASVIGEKITINARSFTVVGVAPAEFTGAAAGFVNELWIPTMMLRTGYRWCNAFEASCAITSVIARLAPGSTLDEARAEVTSLTPQLIAATDTASAIRRIDTKPALGVPAQWQASFANVSKLLSAIAVILLLVASINLSGLLLARGLARSRELALRVSLGASRVRIARQLLTESLVIAGAGALLGVLMSIWTSRVLAEFFARGGRDRRYDVSLDAHVLMFAVAASIAALVVFGLLPALRVSRVDIADTLKRGNGSPASVRARMALVTSQIVLSVLLLIGAGLMTKSFDRLIAGGSFDPSKIGILRLRPRLVGYAPERAQRYVQAALAAIRQVPGIDAAVPVAGHMMAQANGDAVVSRPGDIPDANAPKTEYFEIGPGYLKALGVPLLAGREFTEQDKTSSPLVAMVTESLARRVWPDGKVVGRPLVVRGKQFEVVGVVKDYRLTHAGEGATPMFFTSYWQSAFAPQIDAYVAIRFAGDPTRGLDAIRRAVSAVDANVPVTQAQSMQTQLSAQFTEVRLGRAVLIAGAGLALFLSAVGLYGVVAFLATQRRREIGVRLAIGARPVEVIALFVRQAMWPVWLGGAIGLAASVAAAPLLSRWLFGVEPLDGVATSIAVASVIVVALCATYLPAHRASRTDPAIVFRSE